MDCLKNYEHHSLLITHVVRLRNLEKRKSSTTKWACCSLRRRQKEREPSTTRISTEAIQAIQALKLSKSNANFDRVFDTRLSRLIKSDLLQTLSLLQHQNQVHLSLLVFDYVQKEVWYKPDLCLYNGMLQLLGKNKQIQTAEKLFSNLQEEGLEPDTRAITEMIGAYLQVNRIDKALQMYAMMKASGCTPDEFTFTVLIRNLEDAGREDLADNIKKECGLYMDYPDKFIEKIRKKHKTKTSLKLI